MLSDRQLELLEVIIKEHMLSSEPVGSTMLVDKYNLKYSAATVRNEMARLRNQGFLEMLHASSGRVPTALAYKLFLEDLMQEEELPVLQEVSIKQRLWPSRFEFYRLLRQSALSLADVVKELVIVTTKDGFVTHAGAVNVLDSREFWDIDVARAALHMLDRAELLEQIFKKVPAGTNDLYYALGNELGDVNLASCCLIFAPYQVDDRVGYVSVLGPSRMDYARILPAVRYVKNLVEELGGSW